MAEIKLDDDPVFGRQKEVSSQKKGTRTIEDILDVPILRENMRGRIAIWIVRSLLGIVLLSYITFVILAFRGTPPPSFSDLKDLTEALVAPVVGIVGAVTGFYFGEKHSDKQADH